MTDRHENDRVATSLAESSERRTPSTPKPTANQPGNNWSINDSAELYNVHRWSNGYFDVNSQGNLVVRPNMTEKPELDLKQLVDDLDERGVALPILIRFDDILRHRMTQIHEVFANAIEEFHYQSDYRCIYPVKVNQQRHIVEQIHEHGRGLGFGLEAGSKPELLAVMAMVDDDDTPIICNGFKDDEFIEAVILAKKMGKNIIPIVEKFNELQLIAKYSRQHDVRPAIGVRVKLAARGSGRWHASGGVRSKFGLFISEVLDAVEFLREHDMLDCLKLLHFHLGSQISNIRNIKAGIIELTRIYAELRQLGADLQYLDVGGGLGIDYDGSQTSGDASVNYSLQEYANDVVYHVKEVCDQAKVPHPKIMSESGRAMTAYHSVLVFNTVGSIGFQKYADTAHLRSELTADLPRPVKTLVEAACDITPSNAVEAYHDAQLALDDTMNLFSLGYCRLEHRSLAERAYFALCTKVSQIAQTLEDEDVPEEFRGLDVILSDTYFCNLSIFQSMPDSWAIDQLFPIMPIHRLNEEPTRQGTVADITCDSDGKVDKFIGRGDCRHVLDLHPLKDDEPYYLAAFLVGAYQEILGDLHNLFGDTNAVHITIDEDGEPEIEEVIEGDTVREVLGYVEFSADELKRSIRKRVEKAVRQKKITITESRRLMKFYEEGLEGYTYLE